MANPYLQKIYDKFPKFDPKKVLSYDRPSDQFYYSGTPERQVRAGDRLQISGGITKTGLGNSIIYTVPTGRKAYVTSIALSTSVSVKPGSGGIAIFDSGGINILTIATMNMISFAGVNSIASGLPTPIELTENQTIRIISGSATSSASGNFIGFEEAVAAT